MTPAEIFLEAAQKIDAADDDPTRMPYFYLAIEASSDEAFRACAPFVLTAFPDADEMAVASREERVLAMLFLVAMAEDIL